MGSGENRQSLGEAIVFCDRGHHGCKIIDIVKQPQA